MNTKVTFFTLGIVASASIAAAADGKSISKTIAADPVKIAVGYQNGGVGATAKGELTTAFGAIRNGFTPGFNYGVDGTWNADAKKPDHIGIAARIGLVQTNPGVPALSAFVDLEARNGQYQSGDKLEKVNQVLAGITARWVPQYFTNLILDAAGAGSAADYQMKPCDAPNVTPEERKKCDEADKEPSPVLQFPPHVSLSYYHPVRNKSGAALPEGIEADKITLSFDVDNHLYPRLKMPPHLILSLSATKPMTGKEKKLETKIDAGIGIDVGTKFTPIVKYVSGKKDGFKFDRQLILGLLLHMGSR